MEMAWRTSTPIRSPFKLPDHVDVSLNRSFETGNESTSGPQHGVICPVFCNVGPRRCTRTSAATDIWSDEYRSGIACRRPGSVGFAGSNSRRHVHRPPRRASCVYCADDSCGRCRGSHSAGIELQQSTCRGLLSRPRRRFIRRRRWIPCRLDRPRPAGNGARLLRTRNNRSVCGGTYRTTRSSIHRLAKRLLLWIGAYIGLGGRVWIARAKSSIRENSRRNSRNAWVVEDPAAGVGAGGFLL